MKNIDAFIPASEEEKEYMVQMRPSSTFFRDGARRLRKNKVAMFSTGRDYPLIMGTTIVLASFHFFNLKIK